MAYERALEEFRLGNFNATKEILAATTLKEDVDARLLYVTAFDWNEYKDTGNLPPPSAAVRKADRKIIPWLVDFTASNNGNAALETHELLINRSNGWSIGKDRASDLLRLTYAGSLKAFYFYILSKKNGIPELEHKEAFEKALTDSHSSLSDIDSLYWQGFLATVFTEGKIDKGRFFDSFEASLDRGDGRVYLLACQLSLRFRFENLEPYDIPRFCTYSHSFGFPKGLESLQTAPHDITAQRNLDVETFFEKVKEYKSESQSEVLTMMRDPFSVPHTAARWCESRNMAAAENEGCLIRSPFFHQHCQPNIRGRKSAEEFAKTKAYSLCRAFYHRTIR